MSLRLKPITFVTCDDEPAGTSDDTLAVEALHAQGATVQSEPWSSIKPKTTDILVLRSPWDYYKRGPEFLAWLEHVEASGATLLNDLATVRWNLHKRYLLDLAAQGITIVDTALVTKDREQSLQQLCTSRSWIDVVIKGAVSGGAHETFRLEATSQEAEGHFRRLLQQGDVLVQPYLPEIQEGEWSLVYFGDELSHALTKSPKLGDFQVQEKHGGHLLGVPNAQIPASVRLAADRALQAAPARCLYARVDGVLTTRGFLLMELELIEPELFFRLDGQAPHRFASVLMKALREVA